ncbi:LADA_0D05820g1_1 [Lachancea dasiensis]|uniref:LADA_0D05820g1_1 n=1 Tax=Lachancea dasiensis TaxID=1072105 RepID=A0A1G4J6D1_9SACH|nr:LADA_0D05820g1_1 [Lachancea dasiensis]
MASNLWNLNFHHSQMGRLAPRAVSLVRPNIITIAQLRYSSTHDAKPDKNPQSLDRLHKFIAKSRFLTKLNERPKFRAYFEKLGKTNPVSTVSSFLIMHEITAIVPLFAFWWALYTLNFDEQYDLPVYFKDLLDRCGEVIEKLVGDHDKGFDRNRLVLSGALSYAIVKLLYPLRILVSMWAAPFFLRWCLTPFRMLGRKLRSDKPSDLTKIDK